MSTEKLQNTLSDAEWRQVLRDTITMKDAECQERVERILESITEDFVEPTGNFYMSDKDRQRSFQLWQEIKGKVLKKEEGV